MRAMTACTKCSVMKKILFLLCALTTCNCIAQIPNNGFETWITAGNCMKPSGWYGTNDFSDTSGASFGVTRSADHYPAAVGNYSISIQNNVSLLPDWSALGIIWTGGLAGTDNPAFPVTGHPTSFCGYFKFFPQNNDTMRIFLALYDNGNEVSQISLETNEECWEWTSFCLSIPGYETADSGRIMMAAFYPENNLMPHGNSMLYVDNLSFDGLITSAQSIANDADRFTVFPNPATSVLHINMPFASKESLELKIYDINGRLIYNSEIAPGSSAAVVPLDAFAEGAYFIRITAGNEPVFEQQFMCIR